MNRALKQRSLCSAVALALGSAFSAASSSADAEDISEPRGTIGIEVTGSHINRSDVETALPVQVISQEDIARSGSVTVAELMSKISANVGAFGDALSIGNQVGPFPRPGLASVNLRGIGDGSTLVLVNGRRMANYAFDGGTVDVNSIPVAAIDRVEILKDGASAIYGTDAIAGVVNFILRKDFQGLELTGYGDWTQQGGGNRYQAIVSAGHGDLARDRYNVFVSLNYQNDAVLHASERQFARTGYRPGDGLFTFNAQSFPANINAGHGQLLSPNYASGCAPPVSFALTSSGSQYCAFDPAGLADLLPRTERASAFGRATFQVTPNLQLFVEAGYAHNQFALTISPTPFAQPITSQNQPVVYPAGGPFYPTAFAAANGISGDLNLRYRTVPLGDRVNDVDTTARRMVVGADGFAGGWDYGAGALYSENRQRDTFRSGYVSERRLLDALATGLINPFGPSGPEGDALLTSTQVTGDFHSATGSTWLTDVRASREIAQLRAGPLAIAVGAEARREILDNSFTALAESGDVPGAGGNHHPVAASRTVRAVYAEASVPLTRGLDAQVAARYDDYSDFGSTVNPKVALRWQPVKRLLLRSSWGTGFRAPTLYDLFTPLQHTVTLSNIPDPVRCPVTDLPDDCGGEFPTVVGGNPNLKPEKSEQFNAGLVWEPIPRLALTVDYWKINKSNAIGALSEDDVLAVGSPLATTHVIRGRADPAFPGLPGPIQTLILQNENLGDVRTSGIDIDVSWRGHATSLGTVSFALNGTYVGSFKQETVAGDYVSLVGNNDGPNAVPRWRHQASLNWSEGPWSSTIAQTFQNGYGEADQRSCDTEGNCPGRRRVGSYSIWNLQAQYTGWKNTALVVGVRNLFDRDPPFSQYNPGFQSGYDASYADPHGRVVYTRLTYTFK